MHKLFSDVTPLLKYPAVLEVEQTQQLVRAQKSCTCFSLYIWGWSSTSNLAHKLLELEQRIFYFFQMMYIVFEMLKSIVYIFPFQQNIQNSSANCLFKSSSYSNNWKLRLCKYIQKRLCLWNADLHLGEVSLVHVACSRSREGVHVGGSCLVEVAIPKDSGMPPTPP